MDTAHKLAWYHRIGMPAYHVAAGVLLFHYPLTLETLILFLGTYTLQGLGISVGYHRLFSHRAFQANRITTFILGLLGALAGQGTISRWVRDHRQHHQYTDLEGDPHSPVLKGFWYSHIGWRFDPKTYEKEAENHKIWKEWPLELVWLDRVIPLLFLLYPLILGVIGGWAYVGWGYFVPIVLLWHITFTVNSISHFSGKRIFDTPDASRNNLWIALLIWGEGWHNNHHASPKNVRFGLRWYQLDTGYYLVKILNKLGWTRQLVDQSEAEIRRALENRQP